MSQAIPQEPHTLGYAKRPRLSGHVVAALWIAVIWPVIAVAGSDFIASPDWFEPSLLGAIGLSISIVLELGGGIAVVVFAVSGVLRVILGRQRRGILLAIMAIGLAIVDWLVIEVASFKLS